MTTIATSYDISTGKIGMTMKSDAEDACEINHIDGMGWVLGAFRRDTHYVLNGEPTERPSSPVSRTDLTLQDVPNGATLWISGVSYPAEGDVELEFPLPGVYSLRVECFPYKDWEGEVVV